MVGCDKIFDIEDDNPILRLSSKHIVQIDGKYYQLEAITLEEISITTKEKIKNPKTLQIQELEEMIKKEEVLGVIA